VPGEGEFDLAGFLRLLSGMGVRLPLSVEVMSASRRDARGHGRVCYVTARRP
jgi:sugar phosphate isomerase/epimerase